jgi:hypothetical protein
MHDPYQTVITAAGACQGPGNVLESLAIKDVKRWGESFETGKA